METVQTEDIAKQLKFYNGKLWYTIGILNENEGLCDQAINCYKTALQHNPENREAMSHLAHIYKIKKQYLDAIISYNKYLAINSDDGVAWMNMGECFLALQELNKAHTCMKNANKFLKQDPKLWFQLGNLFEKAGDLEQADMYYKKVLEGSYPENLSELHFKIAMLYKQRGNYDDCYTLLTNECWTNPPEDMTRADILCQLIQIFQLTYSVEIGKDAHEKAMSLLNQSQGDTTFVYILFGWLCHLIVMNTSISEMIHIEEDYPLQILSQVTQSHPQNALGWYVYGRILADSKMNQPMAVFDAFRQALTIDHNNPLHWCSIGNLYYHTEQYGEAIKAYFKAIALTPQLPEVWFNMGALYVYHGQKEDAQSSFNRARDLEPNNPRFNSIDVEKVQDKPSIIDPSPFETLPNYTIETYTKPSLPTNISLQVLTQLQSIRVPDLTQMN